MLPAEVLTTTCTTAPVPEPVNDVTLTLVNVPEVGWAKYGSFGVYDTNAKRISFIS